MVKHNLLLVHSEGDKQRHLEVGLRRAGFNVTRAATMEDAMGRFTMIKPDVVVSQLEMTGGDAYEFWTQVQVQSRDTTPSLPPAAVGPVFVLLGGRSPVDESRTALDLGISDVVPEPHPLHELVGRIRLRLEALQRARLAQDSTHEVVIRGDLGEAGPMDVLESLGNGGRVGTLRMYGAHGEVGSIIFQHGRVVEAHAGRRRGREAVFRLLTLRKGQYEVLAAEERTEVVSYDITELLIEGLEYVENWEQLREQLPPLDRTFEVDPGVLAERLADIPDDVNGVLRLLDGKRSLAEVVEQSPLGDLLALETISRLYFEEVLVPTDVPISMPPVTAVHPSPAGETLPGTLPPGTASQTSAAPSGPSTTGQSDEFKATRSVPLGRISLTKVPIPLAKGFDPNAHAPQPQSSLLPQTQAIQTQGPQGQPAQTQGPQGQPAQPQGPQGQPAQTQATQGQPAQTQGPLAQPAQAPQTQAPLAPPPQTEATQTEATRTQAAQAPPTQPPQTQPNPMQAIPQGPAPEAIPTPPKPMQVSLVPPPLPRASSQEMSPAELAQAAAERGGTRPSTQPPVSAADDSWSSPTPQEPMPPYVSLSREAGEANGDRTAQSDAQPSTLQAGEGDRSSPPVITLAMTDGPTVTLEAPPADETPPDGAREQAEPSRVSSAPLLTIVPPMAEPQRPMLSLVPRLQLAQAPEGSPQENASEVGKPTARKSVRPATAPSGPSQDVVRSSADSPWVSGEAQTKDHVVAPIAVQPSVVVEDGLVATTVTHEQTAPFTRRHAAKRRAAWVMVLSMAAVVAVGMVAIGITQDRRTGFVDSSVPPEEPVQPTDLAQSGSISTLPMPSDVTHIPPGRVRSRGLMGPALPPGLAERAEKAARRAELAADRAEKAASRPEPPPAKIGSDATPAAAQHEESTAALAAKAKSLFRRGRVGQAMQIAKRALLLDGNNDAALAVLGSCYLEQGNTAKATDAAEQALSINSANADAHVVKGFVLQQQGRSSEAKAHYQRYLDLAPRGEHAADLRTLLPSL